MMFLCRPMVDVLKHRGVADPELFLAPSTWRDMPSPFLMEGMEEAVASILAAVRSQKRIAVYGDYDCDGVLSSAILEATLRKLGARPLIYLPHRDEGYGFTEAAVHRFSRSGTDLVLTIDNGINAAGPVRLAQRLGMDVVIVDHHHIETRAEALAVWSGEFCAAGLGLMLCWALLEAAGNGAAETLGFVASMSRLAAIASIADCVPLTGATRTLTRIGLAELAHTRHAGLRKLLLLAGVRPSQAPSSEQIAFRIAPRINAAGRIGHPQEALSMLNAASERERIDLATSLDILNRERRRMEKEALEELVLIVQEEIQKEVPVSLVVYGPQWKKGIAGILASRARERYGVPTVVLVHDARTGMAVGSGRSVEGFNLITALRACNSVLHRFGGHSQAAGVTVAVEKISEFRRLFEGFLRDHPPKPMERPEADADLNIDLANSGFFEQLRSMEPFGVGNPTPIFRVKNAIVRSATPGFVFVRQGKKEIKARSPEAVAGYGTALLALNGTTASLIGFDEKGRNLQAI